jgi:hypothetical protein
VYPSQCKPNAPKHLALQSILEILQNSIFIKYAESLLSSDCAFLFRLCCKFVGESERVENRAAAYVVIAIIQYSLYHLFGYWADYHNGSLDRYSAGGSGCCSVRAG